MTHPARSRSNWLNASDHRSTGGSVQPFAFGLWSFYHLQEIDRRRAWLSRMGDSNGPLLTHFGVPQPGRHHQYEQQLIAEAGSDDLDRRDRRAGAEALSASARGVLSDGTGTRAGERREHGEDRQQPSVSDTQLVALASPRPGSAASSTVRSARRRSSPRTSPRHRRMRRLRRARPASARSSPSSARSPRSRSTGRTRPRKSPTRSVTIHNETARLEAQSKGNDRLERELEIQGAMEGELEPPRRWSTSIASSPSCRTPSVGRRRRARCARCADVASRQFEDATFYESGYSEQIHPSTRSPPAATRSGMFAQYDTESSSGSVRLGLDEGGLQNGYTDKVRALRIILGRSIKGMADLRTISMRRRASSAIGSVSRSSADHRRHQFGAHGAFGDGLKALTGSILIGFGDMMIEIGTQSLLAAQLLKRSSTRSALRP
jgi:hypothetical protein